MELQVGLKAFIKNKKSQYLLLKRSKAYDGGAKPVWTIPGGRMHPHESIEEGLAREIEEETNLKFKKILRVITAQDIFIKSKNRHVIRITFEVEAEGKVELTHEAENENSDFKWVTLKEMKKFECDEILIPVLPLLNLS